VPASEASQSDIVSLHVKDMDCANGTVSFVRQKSGLPVLVHLGAESLNLFKDLPAKSQPFRICPAWVRPTMRQPFASAAASLVLNDGGIIF
jgi:hypothetical protein